MVIFNALTVIMLRSVHTCNYVFLHTIWVRLAPLAKSMTRNKVCLKFTVWVCQNTTDIWQNVRWAAIIWPQKNSTLQIYIKLHKNYIFSVKQILAVIVSSLKLPPSIPVFDKNEDRHKPLAKYTVPVLLLLYPSHRHLWSVCKSLFQLTIARYTCSLSIDPLRVPTTSSQPLLLLRISWYVGL